MLAPEKLLRELIALPSVNPAFPVDDPNWTGEQRMADFLAHWGDRVGLEISFQKVFPGRSNVIARLIPAGGRPKQRILFAPHMDTVGVINANKFKPRQSGDRLFGRGACDTKGSAAAMFSALLQVAAKGPRPKETELAFVGLVDEENEQTGSRKFAQSRHKFDLAIVGEPTRNKLITAHKGDYWLRLETSGKAAHGSKPELGVNAVHRMAQAVSLIEERYSRQLKKKKHPLLGNPTVNTGFIAGGRQPNIVPDQCEILIDRRTLPGEDEKTIRAELKDLFAVKGLNVRVSNKKEFPCAALETDPDLPLVQQLMRTLRQKAPLGVDFFCDASNLSHVGGIPSVVFGPGDISQAHTEDEWISIKSLNRAADQLRAFINRLP